MLHRASRRSRKHVKASVMCLGVLRGQPDCCCRTLLCCVVPVLDRVEAGTLIRAALELHKISRGWRVFHFYSPLKLDAGNPGQKWAECSA